MNMDSPYAAKPWLKHYDFWVPAEINLPRQSLYQILQIAGSSFRDKRATGFLGAFLTFGEVKSQVDRLATSLAKLGVVKGDGIVDVMAAVSDVPRLGPHDLINGVIERFAAYKAKIEAAAAKGAAVPLGSVKLRAPLPRPVNVDCMAVNYMEDGTRKAPAPINAFHKSPGCIIGHGETMVLPSRCFSGNAHFMRP